MTRRHGTVLNVLHVCRCTGPIRFCCTVAGGYCTSNLRLDAQSHYLGPIQPALDCRHFNLDDTWQPWAPVPCANQQGQATLGGQPKSSQLRLGYCHLNPHRQPKPTVPLPSIDECFQLHGAASEPISAVQLGSGTTARSLPAQHSEQAKQNSLGPFCSSRPDPETARADRAVGTGGDEPFRRPRAAGRETPFTPPSRAAATAATAGAGRRPSRTPQAGGRGPVWRGRRGRGPR